jgi:hypothetical protein
MDRSYLLSFFLVLTQQMGFPSVGSYFLLWQLLHAPYGNQCIYSKDKARACCIFWWCYFCICNNPMTLSIDIPDLPPNLTESQLLSKLYDMYLQVESYIISFAVIAAFWVSYHQVFNFIKGSHILIIYLNLLFLLLITFLSVTTSLVINYGSYQIPYIIYCTVVIMTSSLLAIIWWHATKDHRLVDKSIHQLFIKGSW